MICQPLEVTSTLMSERGSELTTAGSRVQRLRPLGHRSTVISIHLLPLSLTLFLKLCFQIF